MRNQPPRAAAGVVLYAARRLESNFGLQRAVEWARELRRPLVIFERSGYRWASERMHRFVLEGMADHADAKLPAGVKYYPYVEPNTHSGEGLLKALPAGGGRRDRRLSLLLPALLRSAQHRLDVRLEAVDSNGLLPISRTEERIFTMAFHFRRSVSEKPPPPPRGRVVSRTTAASGATASAAAP